jgi:hypothetical protein
VEVVSKLSEEHITNNKKYRYSSCSTPLLNEVVKPTVLKLTEDYSAGMAELDPFYSHHITRLIINKFWFC